MLIGSDHLLALIGTWEHMAANRSKASKLLEMDKVDSCCGLGESFGIGHREIGV
jgi:hypothetical protein